MSGLGGELGGRADTRCDSGFRCGDAAIAELYVAFPQENCE
jgi:hypothetical protein